MNVLLVCCSGVNAVVGCCTQDKGSITNCVKHPLQRPTTLTMYLGDDDPRAGVVFIESSPPRQFRSSSFKNRYQNTCCIYWR